jgi:hypothetical protein
LAKTGCGRLATVGMAAEHPLPREIEQFADIDRVVIETDDRQASIDAGKRARPVARPRVAVKLATIGAYFLATSNTPTQFQWEGMGGNILSIRSIQP